MDNAQQVEFWNGAGGQSWVQYQKDLDRAIGAFGEFALEQLAAQAGERVLEVGCGAGTTSLELGRAVGATGRVLGVDVSEALLGLARSLETN